MSRRQPPERHVSDTVVRAERRTPDGRAPAASRGRRRRTPRATAFSKRTESTKSSRLLSMAPQRSSRIGALMFLVQVAKRHRVGQQLN